MVENITEKEREVLEQVKKHKESEPYFFDKLIEKKDIKWLNALKERGFFDKSNVPIIYEGNYYAEEWNVLNYVKSIIYELEKNHRESDIKYVLYILLQAAEASNNYRVIEQSIDILLSTPTDAYDNNVLTLLLDNWFKCNYGISHILYTITEKMLPYVAEHDIDKAFNIFVKFLNKFIELKSDKDYYILKKVISNESLLNNITKRHYKEVVNYIVFLLEKSINIDFATRDINNKAFKIQKADNKYTISVDGREIMDSVFINRTIDINSILKTVKQMYPRIDNEELERNIKLLYSDLFSKEAYESIFEEKEHLFEIHDYLIVLLKKCLLLNISESKETIELLEQMLKNKYDLILKVALFIMCNDIDRYKGFTLKNIKNNHETMEYIVRYYIFGDEIKHLFESFDNLDEASIKIIDSIIEKGEYIKHDWEKDEYLLKWKQKRFFALRKIDYFNKKYISLRKTTGNDVELVAPIRFTGVHWVEQKSPLTKEQILQISNDELVNFIKNFKEEDSFGFSEVSYRGLGDVLKEVIKSCPEKFTDDIEKFDKLHYEIVSSIIDAFKEILKENDKINFIKIVNYLSLYTGHEEFWLDYYCYKSNRRDVVTHIGTLKSAFWLLIEYLSNDKLKFDGSVYKSILDLLKNCFDKHDFSDIEDVLFGNNDYDFYSLNSLAGLFSRILLESALKIKRIKLKGNKLYWNKDIKVLFEKLLSIKCIDAYFTLGQFIGQFTYIDKSWTISKMTSVSFGNEMWEFLMSGYICSRTVYGEYFVLMADNYSYALDYDFKDKDIKKRLIEHIIIAYLNGFEEKGQVKVFEKIIKKWDIDLLEEVIRYCYRIQSKSFAKDVNIDDVKAKIMGIWDTIRNKYEEATLESMTQDEIRLIQNSIHIVTNYNTINDSIAKNLRFSFKFLRGNFLHHDLVEYFEDLIDTEDNIKHKEFIQQLIYEFIINCLPSYPQDKVEKLINYLTDSNKAKDFLDEITQTYMDCRGASFVVKYIVNKL